MARILVRTPNEIKKYRLWCNTADVWVTEPMTDFEMLQYLTQEHYEPHTVDEAIERIFRIQNGINYDKSHLEWIEKYYDSKYVSLCYRDRVNSKAWEQK